MISLIDMKRTQPSAFAAGDDDWSGYRLERAAEADGGPVSYRVTLRVPRWSKGEAPQMTRSVAEGKLPLVP
jgi:hypothetical protein